MKRDGNQEPPGRRGQAILGQANLERDNLDRQLAALGSRITREGQAPERDLWPGIEDRIDRVEQPAGASRRRASWASQLWRVGAMAAVLALAVGLGYVGLSHGPGGTDFEGPGTAQVALRQAETAALDEASMLRRLDSTLQDLNAALTADPRNQNLSRLVLLVHRSRTEVLRGRTRGLHSNSWQPGTL